MDRPPWKIGRAINQPDFRRVFHDIIQFIRGRMAVFTNNKKDALKTRSLKHLNKNYFARSKYINFGRKNVEINISIFVAKNVEKMLKKTAQSLHSNWFKQKRLTFADPTLKMTSTWIESWTKADHFEKNRLSQPKICQMIVHMQMDFKHANR